MQIEVVGFKELMNLYAEDPKFAKAWKACTVLVTLDRMKWLDFIIQDGIFFKGSQLCIPKISMRENLIKEKDSGGLAEHFRRDKTIALVAKNYYWPQLQQDVKKFVQIFRVC